MNAQYDPKLITIDYGSDLFINTEPIQNLLPQWDDLKGDGDEYLEPIGLLQHLSKCGFTHILDQEVGECLGWQGKVSIAQYISHLESLIE